jgi:hypothetical protein
LTPLINFGVVTLGEATINIDYLSHCVLYSLLEGHFEEFVERARAIECQRQTMLDAGWSPISEASRETFFTVVNSRLIDYRNGSPRRKRGELGGPEWAKLVGALRLRILMREFPFWIPGHFV